MPVTRRCRPRRICLPNTARWVFEPKTAAVYAMIENLDANVGRLLAKLDALGLAENTIVMFASDNGPNTDRFNGGMRGRKGSVFEGGQRVPCFIRWPGKLEPGKRVPQIAQHVDVLPTLLDLAGVPLPQTQPLDGVSLAPLLRGTAAAWPERVLFEVTGRGGKDGAPIAKYPGTVRSETHRWVHDGKQEMLFDLRNDPGEKKNIAANSRPSPRDCRKLTTNGSAKPSQPRRARCSAFRSPSPKEPNCSLPTPRSKAERSSSDRAGTTTGRSFPRITAAVVWNLDVPRAGRYEVTALHTAKAAGGRIQVSVGENLVETTVTTAYDPPEIPRRDLVPRWEVPDKEFAPLKLGTLAVPAGTQQLRVKAAPGIEIQSVRLKTDIRVPQTGTLK